MEFQRLEEPAEIGYTGEYQDQADFSPEQYKFILSAHASSPAEVPNLPRRVEFVEARIRELEVTKSDRGNNFQDRWLFD